MKIIIPNFIKFDTIHNTIPFITREADEDFFNNIDDANKYIFDSYCNETYESYNKQKDSYSEKRFSFLQMIKQIDKVIDIIDDSILNNKILPSLINDYKNDTNYKPLFKFMNEDMSLKYELELDELKIIHKTNLLQRNKFIQSNKDEIIQYLCSIKQNYFLKIKNKLNEKNKKYYLKQKELLKIPSKKLLTENEKRENRKNTQQKYFMKHSKFLIQNNIIEPITKDLTELQIKRQEYNRRYYTKKLLSLSQSPSPIITPPKVYSIML
jgi:hypothetical protein